MSSEARELWDKKSQNDIIHEFCVLRIDSCITFIMQNSSNSSILYNTLKFHHCLSFNVDLVNIDDRLYCITYAVFLKFSDHKLFRILLYPTFHLIW